MTGNRLTVGGRASGAWRVTMGLALVLVVYAALFAPGVRHGYVWDDVSTIAASDFFDRPLPQALLATEHERMDEALTAMRGVAFGHESYRPVNVATHWFDVHAFGRRPAPMHVHSLLWGALAIGLAYAVASRLLGDPRWALAVAAIFAFHPLHVEPFVYISARADLVSGALALLASLMFLRALSAATRSGQILALATTALTTLLALFAKESAMALPLALFAFAVALGRTRAGIVGFVVLMATVLLHFPLRAALVPSAPLANPAGLGPTLVRLPGIVLQYLHAMSVPLAISNARPLDPVLTRAGWPLLIGTAAGLGFVVVWWRRRAITPPLAEPEGQQGTEPGEAPNVTPPLHRDLTLALAGLVWAAAFVGPAAVAVGTLGALADRYAYLALFGFALAVTTLVRQTTRLSRLPLLRTAVLAIAGLWVVLLLFVSHREVGVWANNRSLYTHAVTVEPNSAIAHYRLGVLFGSERRWPEAVAAFARAAALKNQLPADVAPTEDRVLNNLGVAHLNLGQITEAERSFRQAIDRSGNVSYRAWFNLAEIAWSRGDRAEACRALSAALSISPKYRAALAAQAARCAPSPPDTNVAP